MRPLAFCRHLDEFGWAPRVLATNAASIHPPLSVDPGLERRLPPTVRVLRVPHGDPLRAAIRFRDSVSRVSRAASISEPVGAEAPVEGSFASWIGRRKSFVLEHLFAFPDHHVSWTRPAIRHALRACRRDPIDAVLATGKPWTSLVVGLKIARALNVPFVADFRDPWTRNPYGEWLPSVLSRAKRLERDICTQASCVVTNTEELREQFANDYPELQDRFVTISNGFDDWTSDTVGVGVGAPKPRGSCLELSHFGTVYGKRDPFALLTAIEQLHQEGRIVPGMVRVRFVGRWLVTSPHSNEVTRALENLGFVVREPQVSHEECLKQMREAHVLLALQPASPLQVPAKMYEYVAMGRPLLVIGGEGATAALVERHGLGRCCSNRIDALKATLRALIDDPTLTAPNPIARAQFHYRELTRTLAQHLDEVVLTRSSRRAGALTLARGD